jgi:ABC-2 type transport system permease protein
MLTADKLRNSYLRPRAARVSFPGARDESKLAARAAMKSLMLFRRVRGFITRDFSLAISYRVDFFMRVLQTIIIVTALFFISYVFKGRVEGAPKQWDDPFVAWITGFALMSFFGCGFSSLANAIRSEQLQGTLENVLMSPIKVPIIIIASTAWEFLQASFFAFLYLFLGWSLFGVQYKGNLLLATLVIVMTALVLHCVGILSASFTLVFKRGDPFGAMLATGSFIFSGVLFPTESLGRAFSFISCVLPTTYGLDGVRRVLIQGQGWGEVLGTLATLSFFLIGLIPFSLILFGGALRRAKREGSLVQY